MGNELARYESQPNIVVRKGGKGGKGGDGLKNDVTDTAKFCTVLVATRVAGNAAEEAGVTKTPLIEIGVGLFTMLAGKKKGLVSTAGKALITDATIRMADGLYKGGRDTLLGKKDGPTVTATVK